MLPPDTTKLKLQLIHAKINQRESEFSVAGAIHPTPEDVGAAHTNKNLQTRHRIPAVMAARKREITTRANEAAHRPVSPSPKERKPAMSQRGFEQQRP